MKKEDNMEMTKEKGSRALAGALRNPSRDPIKNLKRIIPHRRRRRYRVILTDRFWMILESVAGGILFAVLIMVMSIIIPILFGGY